MSKNTYRQDAYSKITGKAKYVNDLVFPDMLHTATIRSPYPHARIISIDTSGAEAFDGVVGIYSAKDVKGLNALPNDKPVLVENIAKCYGDGVLVVAADTKEQAEKAARQIHIEYEQLSAVFEIADALSEASPKVHGNTNIAASHKTIKGNIEDGFRDADIILERDYTTQRAMHAAIEPDGAIAVPDADGVTLYCPGKGPFNIKRAVALACALPEHKVRLIQPAIGGAFGGKDYDSNIIAARATMIALDTGRPCKMVWSREEVLIEGTKRHPFKLHYKVGAKKDGRLTAMEITGSVDVGAYLSKSAATIWRATVEATGPYNLDHIATRITGVFTNNVYSDAVRGFGSPQVDFASESLMTDLARELGLSPYEIRMINAFDEGSISATGQTLTSVNLKACLKQLQDNFPVDEKITQPDDKYKLRGRGISCIFRGEAMGAGFPIRDAAEVNIRVEKDGTIQVLSGIAEMGQGGGNVVLQIISETIGVDIETLRLSPLDTAYVSDSGATVGSRGTITSGNAAYEAAKDLKMRIAAVIARNWHLDANTLIFENNHIFSADKRQQISFHNAIIACLKEMPVVYGYGWWALKPVWWDFEKNVGETYASFNYAACGAEVEIDLISGAVNITDAVSIHDVGCIINPPEVGGQIAGGASMGFGMALSEEVVIENGIPKTLNYDDYLLPTTLDFNKVRTIALVEKPGNNPLGVKGIGESSTATLAPAILNAIRDALGVNIRSLPADLNRVEKAIEDMGGDKQP